MVCLTSVYFNMCQLNFKIVRIISEFYMANFIFIYGKILKESQSNFSKKSNSSRLFFSCSLSWYQLPNKGHLLTADIQKNIKLGPYHLHSKIISHQRGIHVILDTRVTMRFDVITGVCRQIKLQDIVIKKIN